MKKILALLLAMLVALPALASGNVDLSQYNEAELRALIDQANGALSALITANYTEYQNPLTGYRITYPRNWVLLDSSNIDVVIADGSYPGAAFYRQQILDQNVAVITDASNGDNINITYQDTEEALDGNSFLASYGQEALAQVRAQLNANDKVTDIAVADSGSVYTFGDNNLALIGYTYTADGAAMGFYQVYAFAGTMVYIISCTFTKSNQAFIDSLDTIMASFAAK
jgi:hypothetical protein